jgi:hypothetical protein
MDYKAKVKKFSIEKLRDELKIQRKLNYNSFETYWCIFRLKELSETKECAEKWSNYATENIWRTFGCI